MCTGLKAIFIKTVLGLKPHTLDRKTANDLADHVFDGVELVVFKRLEPMIFYLPKLLAPFLSSAIFHFSYFLLQVGIVGLGYLH